MGDKKMIDSVFITGAVVSLLGLGIMIVCIALAVSGFEIARADFKKPHTGDTREGSGITSTYVYTAFNRNGLYMGERAAAIWDGERWVQVRTENDVLDAAKKSQKSEAFSQVPGHLELGESHGEFVPGKK